MPDGHEPLTAHTVDGIAAVGRDSWDACAGGENPFVSYGFLSALEDSGSVGNEAGWMPFHIVVENGSGEVLGCAPLYLKSHSYGEYVFDHGWADAYERAGGAYYPKLQCAVPFTPVTGSRFLVRADADRQRVRDGLISAMVQFAERLGVSSLHVTFLTADEYDRCGSLGLLQRIGQQYHWRNDGYGTFEDFLATLTSRRRKDIRKERRRALSDGLFVRALTGDALTPRYWDAFFHFYRNTSDRKWGDPYLTRSFFDLIGERLADRVVLFIVEDDGRPVAGALNLRDEKALYGRNWGCIARYKFLHFETCYYQAIDYAIEHGLERVEAGAQGPHKIHRGYVPVKTYSAHWIRDPSLRHAIAQFLEREREAVEFEIEALACRAPFRREDGEND
jgi:predicted N-acyltransferase